MGSRATSAMLLLAIAATAGCGSNGIRQYEYEEEVYLNLDGSATLIVNSSLAALVALRGVEVPVESRARFDRAALRRQYESPVAEVTRVSRPWRRDGRRFVQVRVEVSDIRRLNGAPPFAWSTYRFERTGDEVTYKQLVAQAAGRAVAGAGWDGTELVAFRMHLPSRINYHDAPSRQVERGNILVWEQTLRDRLAGRPVQMEARMESESILYRTLWLFALAFTAAVASVAALIWWAMRRGAIAETVLLLVLLAGAPTGAHAVRAPIDAVEPVATFSILGFDPATGEVGGAVQSRVFSVGNGVLWAEADVGVIATQAIVDVSYGPQGLALLRRGLSPEAIVKQLWEQDPDPRPKDWTKQGRQFAVMDAKGNVAVFTGPKATPWAGHRVGKFCSAQGNILAGEAVVTGMVQAFEQSSGPLSLRLMAALDAGQAGGGDTRGMQSAAMVVVKKAGGVWLNNDVVLRLQVDDSPEPLKELRRLVELAAARRSRQR